MFSFRFDIETIRYRSPIIEELVLSLTSLIVSFSKWVMRIVKAGLNRPVHIRAEYITSYVFVTTYVFFQCQVGVILSASSCQHLPVSFANKVLQLIHQLAYFVKYFVSHQSFEVAVSRDFLSIFLVKRFDMGTI